MIHWKSLDNSLRILRDSLENHWRSIGDHIGESLENPCLVDSLKNPRRILGYSFENPWRTLGESLTSSLENPWRILGESSLKNIIGINTERTPLHGSPCGATVWVFKLLLQINDKAIRDQTHKQTKANKLQQHNTLITDVDFPICPL